MSEDFENDDNRNGNAMDDEAQVELSLRPNKLAEYIGQKKIKWQKIAAGGKQTELPADAVFDDALSALINLGYQRNAAEKAMNQAVKDGAEISVQKLLRKSLQLLAKG